MSKTIKSVSRLVACVVMTVLLIDERVVAINPPNCVDLSPTPVKTMDCKCPGTGTGCTAAEYDVPAGWICVPAKAGQKSCVPFSLPVGHFRHCDFTFGWGKLFVCMGAGAAACGGCIASGGKVCNPCYLWLAAMGAGAACTECQIITCSAGNIATPVFVHFDSLGGGSCP